VQAAGWTQEEYDDWSQMHIDMPDYMGNCMRWQNTDSCFIARKESDFTIYGLV
jgi:hypothetical protein